MDLQRLLNLVKQNSKDVEKNVAPGSALAAGFGMLEGPKAALAYGAADFLGAYPLTMGARALGTKITKPVLGIQPQALRSGLENVANIGGSLGSTVAASSLLYGGQPVTPTVMSQEQQIMQEMSQRAAINNLDVQAVAPGTQFQTAGIEFLNDYVNRKPPSFMDYLSQEDLALLAEAGGMPRG